MARYKLGKPQIKRLLEGKSVMDGHGRHFYANEEVKNLLQQIHDNNLYDRFNVILDGREIDIVTKEGNSDAG